MRLPQTILFDLDGTLVDTAPDLAAAMNHVLARHGRPPLPVAAVRHLVGHGARALITRGLAAGRAAPPAPAAVDAAVPAFLAHYADHIADASRPWPGVVAALDALAAAGCRLGVCTNKPAALANALLQALGLASRFAAIIGGDAVPRPKPDAGHVLATINACGGHAGDAVLVGDSAADLGGGRAAGVPVVLVSFGYSDPPAAALGADAVIDHFDALLPVLAGFAAGVAAGVAPAVPR